MVQNIYVTAVTPLQDKDEITCWENRPFSGRWPQSRCDKSPDNIKRTIKKKGKRIRTAYTTDQLKTLEHIFINNKYITAERRREIANALKIGDKSVKIWFQNRRMKEKRSTSESSDSSCDTSGDVSPPLPVIDITTSEQANNPASYEPVNNHATSDSSQLQDAHFDYNSYEQSTEFLPDNSSAYGMQFYYDNNVYPTQYYPNDYNYPNDYYGYQNQQECGHYNNYWTSNISGQYYS